MTVYQYPMQTKQDGDGLICPCCAYLGAIPGLVASFDTEGNFIGYQVTRGLMHQLCQRCFDAFLLGQTWRHPHQLPVQALAHLLRWAVGQ